MFAFPGRPGYDAAGTEAACEHQRTVDSTRASTGPNADSGAARQLDRAYVASIGPPGVQPRTGWTSVAAMMDGMTRPSAFTVLLDPTRLIVAGALVGVSRTSEQVQTHTGLDARSVLKAIAELRLAGLVEAIGATYSLPPENLQRAASEVAEPTVPMDPSIGFGMTEDEQQVLRRFFEGRTLREIPTNRSKRLIVLERLSLELDVGRRYAERELNGVLQAFHPDHAALRRHLVDEGFLDRRNGQYWRTGGRVPLDGETTQS